VSNLAHSDGTAPFIRRLRLERELQASRRKFAKQLAALLLGAGSFAVTVVYATAGDAWNAAGFAWLCGMFLGYRPKEKR